MPGNLESHPIHICNKGIRIRGPSGLEEVVPFEPGIGAVYLGPLEGERLELLVWGFDVDGLRSASRLMPSLTGVGQPDFVIVRKECMWLGAAGVIAMGFFDYTWNVSKGSYLM